MILDGHMHIIGDETPDYAGYRRKLDEAGVAGGIVISSPPACFGQIARIDGARRRLENLSAWIGDDPELVPFFWIDPVERNAAKQVELAVKHGVRGFKVICDRYFPHDPKAMKIFGRIAKHDKPILFHSGISWTGLDSSRRNRPTEFECLLSIPNLRFSLAHIGWPWHDEMCALFGKFTRAQDWLPLATSAELYLDLTPGPRGVYREEALFRLKSTGYPAAPLQMFFGSDQRVAKYNVKYVRELVAGDQELLKKNFQESVDLSAYLSGNLRRFIGQ